MKKVLLFVLAILLTATVASAENYSKGMAGAAFGDEDVCFGSAFCVNDNTMPALNTDVGYYFYVTPVAVRKPLYNDIGVRLESEFSVSKREFDLEYTGEEKSLTVNGEDSRYSFGGNVLLDYKSSIGGLVPYAGIGAGVEYSKLTADFSSNRGRGPFQASTHDDFGRYWKYIVGVEGPIMGNVKWNVEYNHRQADRWRDNDSQVNWNSTSGEDIVNAGVTVYW